MDKATYDKGLEMSEDCKQAYAAIAKAEGK